MTGKLLYLSDNFGFTILSSFVIDTTDLLCWHLPSYFIASSLRKLFAQKLLIALCLLACSIG